MFVRVLYELFFLNIFFERRITRGNDRSRLLLSCEYTVVFLKGLNNVECCLGCKNLSIFGASLCAKNFFTTTQERQNHHTRDTRTT